MFHMVRGSWCRRAYVRVGLWGYGRRRRVAFTIKSLVMQTFQRFLS